MVNEYFVFLLCCMQLLLFLRMALTLSRLSNARLLDLDDVLILKLLLMCLKEFNLIPEIRLQLLLEEFV